MLLQVSFSIVLLIFFVNVNLDYIKADSLASCSHGTQIVRNAYEHSNGSLEFAGHVYPRSAWWKNEDGAFSVCKCVVKPCVRKCCKQGRGTLWEKKIHNQYSQCVKARRVHLHRSGLRPSVYNANLTLFMEQNGTLFDNHFDIVHGIPCSDQRLIPYEDELNEIYVLTNGRLWRKNKTYSISQYCYEVTMDTGRLLPIICIDTPDIPVKETLIHVGMLISSPFIAVSFIVYAVLPSLQTVHGCSLMSYSLALFTAYVFFPNYYLFYHHMAHQVQMMFAFVIYFAFLASFFWLNVMCLDIWWTFSGFRPMRGSVKEREHKKFIIYSLYCWGSPLIMLIICMVMDLHPDIPDSYIKPGFGVLKCWFQSNMGNFVYFSGPIAILIICNIILFILTAVKIRQVKRGTKILKKQDSRRHNEEEENNTQRFNLYFKLFLVMGVNWIMEIVSFAAGGPDEYWYITDIANTLQGVLIFIIFVWKDRIRKLLVERFCPGRAANTNSLANSSSTRTTGIRHNGSVMSSHRPSFKNKDDYQMKTLTSPSARSDDSDVA